MRTYGDGAKPKRPEFGFKIYLSEMLMKESWRIACNDPQPSWWNQQKMDLRHYSLGPEVDSASGSCKHLQHWKPYHLRAISRKPLVFPIGFPYWCSLCCIVDSGGNIAAHPRSNGCMHAALTILCNCQVIQGARGVWILSQGNMTCRETRQQTGDVLTKTRLG